MIERYICYCGLYCGNCATKTKVEPAAKRLYHEMKAAGFEDIMEDIPGGEGFWVFLKDMSENGACISCREGSGNPGCPVRSCAKEKGVELCALCNCYPCKHFSELLEAYPNLRRDNTLLQQGGLEAWGKLQDERRVDALTQTMPITSWIDQKQQN